MAECKIKDLRLSREQQTFLRMVREGKNIVCDAVAGGAKSTTALIAMAQNPNRRFFCFTYNRFLTDNSNARVQRYGLVNSDFFTYHAAMNYLYDVDEVVKDDFVFNTYLEKIQRGEVRPSANINGIDVVVCDEAQDLRSPYYRFIQCLERDTNTVNVQFIVIGSVDQLLYDFYIDSPADIRYLTMAPSLYQSQREWVTLCLSVSFRLTPKHAAFANYLSGTNKITASNLHSEDKPVEVWFCDPQSVQTIQKVYDKWILPHPPGSVTLLFPSMDRGCRVVVNTLIHRYMLKVKIQSRDVPEGWTVTVSTFHAYKGLENAHLVVFGLENPYYPSPTVSNAVHVAVTRSNSGSMLILHNRAIPLPSFARGLETCPFVSIQGTLAVAPTLTPSQNDTKDHPRFVVVNNLTRFMEAKVIDGFLTRVQLKREPPGRVLRPTFPVTGTEISPDQFKVLKIAYLLKTEFLHHHRCTTGRKKLYQVLQNLPPDQSAEYNEKVKTVQYTDDSTWLSLAKVIQAVDDFQHLLGETLEMETQQYFSTISEHKIDISGEILIRRKKKLDGLVLICSIDALDEKGYPYLVVDQLDPVDLLGVALQAAFLDKTHGYVVVLRTGEKVSCTASRELLDEVIDLKHNPPVLNGRMEDTLFLQNCLTTQ